MTDSQVKYQTLREDMRHNLEMERYSQIQAKAAETTAFANLRKQALAEQYAGREMLVKEQQALAALKQASSSQLSASSGFVSSLGNLMRGAASVASLFA